MRQHLLARRFTRPGPIVLALVAAALLIVVKTADAQAAELTWGPFKADACSGWRLRQYSSRLWNIPGGASWEDTCQRTSARVPDEAGKVHEFSAPSRCVNMGIGGMWGEFDVRDPGCVPNWGSFKRDACTGLDLRQYSSVLENIPPRISPNGACLEFPARVTLATGVDQAFDKPSRCPWKYGQQWGEFDLRVADCKFPVQAFVDAMEAEGTAFSSQCLREVFEYNNPADPTLVRYRTDGCSAPVGDPESFRYKDAFFGACVVHDTCYTLPWADGEQGKAKCESAFYRQMTKACNATEPLLGCLTAAGIWVAFTRGHADAQAAFNNGQAWRKQQDADGNLVNKIASCATGG